MPYDFERMRVVKAVRATVEGFTDKIARLQRLGMTFAIFKNEQHVGQKISILAVLAR
ncbi:hypothetical protein [Pseudomonas viridiflava]|uniref:hypothetical protein n=1 Tax=Pseudomonas viridiflava TaxID=33069 RepID=UPI0013DF36AE|nr:hypothetical protein [Pseudomonas viridiflava]